MDFIYLSCFVLLLIVLVVLYVHKLEAKEEMVEKVVKITLTYQTYKKLYYLSIVKQMTMDDLVAELIDNSKIE